MSDNLAVQHIHALNNNVKRFKRGDIKSDGKVFWKYAKDKPVWLKREDFEARRQKNIKRCKEYHRLNGHKAREKARNTTRRWYRANKDKKKQDNASWRENNRERMKAYARTYVKYRTKKDPVYAIKRLIRPRVYSLLNSKNLKKAYSLKQYLGCSSKQLKSWIESLFTQGMTWENRGRWHIDHIVPICLAKTSEEVHTLNHFTNLRPLWAKDNLSKNKKLPERLPEYINKEVQKIWKRHKNTEDIHWI